MASAVIQLIKGTKKLKGSRPDQILTFLSGRNTRESDLEISQLSPKCTELLQIAIKSFE